jgi:CDP-glycerol glycerophosphotransferase (TagB/SpsB family)
MESKENLLLEEDQEIWKDILGYEGIYQISSLGRVKSLRRETYNGKGYFNINEKFLKQRTTTKGYYSYSLTKNNKTIDFLSHRLIAVAFIDNPSNKRTVNHKDSVRNNNSISNLEWASYRENHCHRVSKMAKSSKYVGVCFHKATKKWESNICVSGKSIHLGIHKTEEEAYQVRCDYEKNNNIENKYL